MTEKDKDTALEQKLTESVSGTFDSQPINEEITSGDKDAPSIDVEDDYKRAKKYESADRSASDGSSPAVMEGRAESDPEAFRSVAKSVNQAK